MSSSTLAYAFGILLAAGLLAWHASSFYPFMADDAFISLRYSRRLMSGHGLTWDSGPRVEGYSNLTWVLACAALGLVGVDLVIAARVVGALSTLAVFAAIACAFRPKHAGPWAAPSALLGLAVSSPIAVWAIGGLEQPLVAAFLSWILVLVVYPERLARAWPRAPFVLFPLLVWSRPDGIMLAGLVVAGAFLGGPFSWARLRQLAALFASAFAAFLLQLTFRKLYYNDWVPNPAHIKLALTPERLKLGSAYLTEAVTYLSPTIVALFAVLGVSLFRARDRAKGLTIGLVAAGWASYVAFVGGDIFPARRHVVLLLVLGGFAVAELLDFAQRRVRPRAALSAVGAAYVLVLGFVQTSDPQIASAKGERWEWDGKVVGLLLKKAFGAQAPLLAVDPAGCLPYFSELPSIDMLGLNDRYIALHPPENLGKGLLAHEFGDGKYVLSREPDLALFCLPHGSDRPCFRSAAQMLADPAFSRDYRLLTFEGRTPYTFRSRIWTRLESSKIGVRRSPESISVPGYYFAEGKNTFARLNREGQLVAVFDADGVGKVRQLSVPAGSYLVQAQAKGKVKLSVNRGAQVDSTGKLVLRVDKEGRFDLSATPEPGERSLQLSSVTLQHITE